MKQKEKIIDTEIQSLKDLLQRDFSKKNVKMLIHNANDIYRRSQEIEYVKGIYGALNILGSVSFNICDYKKAQKYFLKSIDAAEDMKDERSVAFGLNNIGIILYRLRKYRKALEYYEKSLEIKLKYDDMASISTSYNNIGLVYHSMKDPDKALRFFKKALKIDKDIDNKYALCRELSNIGLVWKSKKDLDKSLSFFKRSYKESANASYDKGMATALSNISNHYLSQKNYQNALKKAFEGEKISKKIHSNNHLLHFYEIIALSYEGEKNYKKALQYHKKFAALNEKIHSDQSHEKILEMQIKYESEKKERETEIYKIKSEELALLNSKKDRFFRIIHHDLLNPFTAMHSTAAFLIKFYEKLDSKKRKSYIEMIHSSSERLIKLMDNLFEWVKTQHGEIEYLPERVDLKEVTEYNLELLGNNINSKDIKISADFCKNCFVDADKNMTDTIIRNLIANAIKFTFSGGEIKIATKCSSKTVRFSVEDDGTGIEPENLKKLFDVSQTFSTPGTGDEKGTGLGLILVKEFLDLNNGRISVESEPGKGSKFTIELPTYKLN